MPDAPRVLVVDDEPTIVEFLALTIRGMGFEVDCALDGRAALDAAGERPPALAFVDALLPRMDGFQVLAELRRAHPDLPVIMMSGIYKKRSYQADAVDRLGARAYLHKPLGVVQVWQIVEAHLGVAPPGAIPQGFPGVPFRERPLPAVIADLHQAAETGLLFVRGSAGSAILYFEDGKLVFGRSNDPANRLDRVLRERGLVDDAAIARAREQAGLSRSGARFGETLVAQGALTEEQLREALAEQVRRHVARPLTWKDGACHFFRTPAPRDEPIKLGFDVRRLVAWGCRQMAADEGLVRWLPAPGRRVRLARPAAEIARTFELSEHEAQLVELVDGTRSVGKLRAIARMAQVDWDRVLAMLHCLGDVDVVDADDPPPAASDGGAMLVPAAGNLAQHPPARVLVGMALARRTGVLTFERSEGDRQVQRVCYLDDGQVAFARSNAPADRLGQVLLAEGLVQRDQLKEVLEEARSRAGAVLGRLLVDRGLLTLDDLHRALVAQVHRVLDALAGWREGTFHLREGSLPIEEIVPLGLDTMQVVLHGLRQCPFQVLAPSLPPAGTVLRAPATPVGVPADLELEELESRIALAVDRPVPLRSLLRRLPDPAEDVLRAVHGLLSVGLIEGHLVAVDRPADTGPLAIEPEAGWDDEIADVPAGDEAVAGSSSRARIGPDDDHAPEALGDDGAFGEDEAFDDEAFGADEARGQGPLSGPETEVGPRPPGPEDAPGFAPIDVGDGVAMTPTSDAVPRSGEDDSAPVPWARGDGAWLDGDVEEPDSRADDATDLGADLEAVVASALGRGAPTPGGFADRRAPGSAVGAAVATATATAVLEAEGADAWTADERAAVAEFLSRLAFHLAVHPGSVGEEVLAALPPHLRKRFGL